MNRNLLFFNTELTPLRKLLMMHVAAGGKLIEATATPGNPCTFTTDVSKALTQCKVNFSPVQESGTPSPEQPLPITGWTGIHVYHSGEDETDYDTYTVDWTSSGTKHGGNIDLATGVLTEEWELIENKWGDITKGTVSQETGLQTGEMQFTQPVSNVTSQGKYGTDTISNLLSTIYWGGSAYSTSHYYINSTGKAFVTLPSTTDNDQLIQIAARLTTPQTIQLTAQQITSLIGENNLWSDANGNLEVKYMKKG